MNAHHPYHSAYRNLRTIKTPVVLRNKRRKWALSLTRKRLAAILLLYCALLAGPTVITAQTLQPSRLASTASAENVLATARDNVEPNLSTARVPDHAAAGGSSFIKRAVRGVLRFTKSLFSAFGEGESSIRKVEPKSNDQDEVTIRSDATVDPPGFDRPEGSAKVLVNAVPPKLADEGLAIKFEVDRKEVDQEFRVLLYVDNKVVEPARVGRRFIVPSELKNQEKVQVRFLSGKYDLSFDPVYAPKFETDWVVGIDNAPFDSENIDSEIPDPQGKKLLGHLVFRLCAQGGRWNQTCGKGV